MRVPWLFHACDVTLLCVWRDLFTRLMPLIYTCDMTHTCIVTHSFVWRNSMNRSYVCHDSFICVRWRLHISDMTHSYVSWFFLICHMTHPYHMFQMKNNKNSLRACWCVCMCVCVSSPHLVPTHIEIMSQKRRDMLQSYSVVYIRIHTCTHIPATHCSTVQHTATRAAMCCNSIVYIRIQTNIYAHKHIRTQTYTHIPTTHIY